MTPKVYLAGPISGQPYEGATNWREYAARKLALEGIAGISPMRGKSFLDTEKRPVLGNGYDAHVMTTPKGITTRDRFDCQRADVVLFNFGSANSVSIGSCIEIGWADAARTPIVVVMAEDNPHWHGMIRECAGFIVPTLDEAIDVVVRILGG